MDEELIESFKTIGEQYIKEEKYKEVLEYYEQLVNNDKSNKDLYLKKALCEKNLNLYKKSLEDYEKAIKINEKLMRKL